MGSKPTQSDCFGCAVYCLNQTATLSDQSSFVCLLNRTNKILKQRWSASNRILFLLKTKNLSNQTIVRSKIDLCMCIWNVMTKLELSSKNETSSNRFSDQIVLLKFQSFQSNLLQLPNYQRFDLLPFKNDDFLWKNCAKKVTWNFSNFHYLNGFNRKTYNIGRPIF